jgi:hypothetical protein
MLVASLIDFIHIQLYMLIYLEPFLSVLVVRINRLHCLNVTLSWSNRVYQGEKNGYPCSQPSGAQPRFDTSARDKSANRERR